MYVCIGNHGALGEWNHSHSLGMKWDIYSEGVWIQTVEIPLSSIKEENFVLRYKYIVMEGDELVREEGWENKTHYIDLSHVTNDDDVIDVHDQWRAENSIEGVFSTSAFNDCVFYRPEVAHKEVSKVPLNSHIDDTASNSMVYVRFQIVTPRVESLHHVSVGGNIAELGAWDLKKLVTMNSAEQPLWVVQIQVPRASFPLQYKYVIVCISIHPMIDTQVPSFTHSMFCVL